MRVIPKRASVCSLHADAVAAHPSLYRGMHFASCSCREGEVPNNDREFNNHRGWNPDEIMPWQASLGLESGLIFIPANVSLLRNYICVCCSLNIFGHRMNKDSFSICYYVCRSNDKQEEFTIITDEFGLRSEIFHATL